MITEKKIDEKIDYWRKKLIDLSKRNNLISYRFTKSRSIQILNPDFKQLIEDLDDEKDIQFLKTEERDNVVGSSCKWVASESDEIVEKKLYNLYLKARNNFQELGVTTGFVSVGVVKYTDAASSDIEREAPIFIYAVEIERMKQLSKQVHRIKINSSTANIQVNPALAEKVEHDHGISLRELGEDEDIPSYFKYLRKELAPLKWTVAEVFYFDIFMYQKFIMYEDLEIHRDLIKNNPLIRAYMGDRDALQDEISLEKREEFDDTTEVDVLEADSTQKRAIELAKAGVTFVLQGPPGTGKSQTIVNIIAALIKQQKKILFVSQKMAALNVVEQRLKKVGLDIYTLNLHKYCGNKKDVVRQFMKELETSPKIPPKALQYPFDHYLEINKELNDYYKFLCTKREPWGLSLYEMRGRLAKLSAAPIIDCKLGSSLKTKPEELNRILGTLERMQSCFNEFSSPTQHLLYHFKKDKDKAADIRNFEVLLKSSIGLLANIEREFKNLKSKTGKELEEIEDLETLAHIQQRLHEMKDDAPGCYLTDDFKDLLKTIHQGHELLEEQKDLEDELHEVVKPDFLKVDTREQGKIIRETGFFQRLGKSYRMAKTALSVHFLLKPSRGQLLEALDWKQSLYKCNKRIEKFKEKNKKALKEINRPLELKSTSKLIKVGEKFEDLFDKAEDLTKAPMKTLRFLAKSKVVLNDFMIIKGNLNDINKHFTEEILDDDDHVNDIKEGCERIREKLDFIRMMLHFKEQLESLPEDIQEFVRTLDNSTKKSEVTMCFQRGYYEQVIDLIKSQEDLHAPRDLVKKYVNDDFTTRDFFRYVVMDSIEAAQPKLNFASSGPGEVSILKRENQKKRRIKPVRELLELIPNLAFTLKPCFMMSPLTVSQYINPRNIQFDVVIFDEASQIMPEDAVTCLIRAKQAIIMGDTQQLPPTTFFMARDDDEDVDEDIIDLPSFLSEASTRFREKRLEWHYRSRNESLIAFSNRYFYDNRLVTFPNPLEGDTGIEYVFVEDGIYDRGKSRTNRREAREVVRTYSQILKKYPGKSVGIIAFSISQERAIRNAFMMAGVDIDSRVDSTKEDLFIKNLETVQGDERDIILLSVGYGKDSAGKLTYHFGPINKEGGYKRLNVAITRSRYKLYVVSSIRPEELDLDKINAEGLRYLKHYLDYANSGRLEAFVEKTGDLAFDSSFEEAVYDALVKEGYSVSSQVGSSSYRIDLAIKHPKQPGKYILAVECDGAQYHSSRYARDRDKIRQGVLEGLGWEIYRIWSEDWIRNPERELQLIRERVDKILSLNGERVTSPSPKFSSVESVEDFEEVCLKSHYPEYEVAELRRTSRDIDFNDYPHLGYGDGGDKIAKLMIKVLEVESPMEIDFLYKRVLAAFDIKQLGKRIRRYMDNVLAQLKKKKTVVVDKRTVALKELPVVTPVRISKEKDRPFIMIPKEELAGAVVDILKHTFSATEESLISDVAKGIFHNTRTGSKINIKMRDTLRHLDSEGIIEEKQGKITLVDAS